MQNSTLTFMEQRFLAEPGSTSDMLLQPQTVQIAGLENANRHLPDSLYGDQIRLKQILINLTKNALKFTLRGNIYILASYDEETAKLIVHVVDTGKGINNREMSVLFKQFGKLERTGAMNVEGIGLGLAICKRIVNNSGGEISVSSSGENKGSTFKFSMQMDIPASRQLQDTLQSGLNNNHLDDEESKLVQSHSNRNQAARSKNPNGEPSMLDLLNKMELDDSEIIGDASNRFLAEKDLQLENPMSARNHHGENDRNWDQDSDLSLNFGVVHKPNEKEAEKSVTKGQIKMEKVPKLHYKQGAIDIQNQLLIDESAFAIDDSPDRKKKRSNAARNN